MTTKQDHGTPFSSTAGSVFVASAIVSGLPVKTIYVTDISGSSDYAAGTIAVFDGSTILWQDRLSSTSAYQHSFIQPLRCSVGATCTVTVSGTTVCYANVSGFYLNNS